MKFAHSRAWLAALLTCATAMLAACSGGTGTAETPGSGPQEAVSIGDTWTGGEVKLKICTTTRRCAPRSTCSTPPTRAGHQPGVHRDHRPAHEPAQRVRRGPGPGPVRHPERRPGRLHLRRHRRRSVAVLRRYRGRLLRAGQRRGHHRGQAVGRARRRDPHVHDLQRTDLRRQRHPVPHHVRGVPRRRQEAAGEGHPRVQHRGRGSHHFPVHVVGGRGPAGGSSRATPGRSTSTARPPGAPRSTSTTVSRPTSSARSPTPSTPP